MKIAVVTAATSTFSNYRLDMVKTFVELGHDVYVFGDEFDDKWVDYFDSFGITYRGYPVSRNGMNPYSDIKTERSLERLFRNNGIDAVWTYQAKPNIYGCIAAHRVGIDRIYAMMGGLGSVFRAEDVVSRITKGIVSFEYRIAFRHVSKVFFQNRDDVELFESLGIIENNKIVMTKGSGVNVEEYPFVPMPVKKSFLFVGRLVKGKGVFEFLEAAKIVKASHPDYEFHIVGPFDSNPTSVTEEQLKNYTDSGVVIYHGEQMDVRPYLAGCSCFVLPSYYGEGTPKSGLEAMATGRPLIVADAPGTREVVKKGVNGLLVEPKNVFDLVEKIEWMGDNEKSSIVMGQSSRRMAEEEFDVRLVNQVICSAMGA